MVWLMNNRTMISQIHALRSRKCILSDTKAKMAAWKILIMCYTFHEINFKIQFDDTMQDICGDMKRNLPKSNPSEGVESCNMYIINVT